MLTGAVLRQPVIDRMKLDRPDFDESGCVCHSCNAKYRADYVRSLLEKEMGPLDSLEEEVVRALRDEEMIAENLNEIFNMDLSVGQKVADRVAKFGGSWPFIGLFSAIIVIWMGVNVLVLTGDNEAFDPYPFILLNLMLSTLAALQAPIIMMSQNRQASKDRMQAELEYRVNLKAEVEIRMLHTKLDQLLNNQWQRLIEIQQLQMDLMEEIGRGENGSRA